ncbi:MAG: hypothetical protein FJZ63_05580, partial [Chlamydiae bacterium]|nr:hypothetical protein [Chlamydiota bacterium]
MAEQELIDITNNLENLYKALNGRSLSKLIAAIRDTLPHLNQLIESSTDDQHRIFRTPLKTPPPTATTSSSATPSPDISPLLADFHALSINLTAYLKLLEGETYCSRAELKHLRTSITSRLLSPIEANYFLHKKGAKPPFYAGLIAVCLEFQNRQTGTLQTIFGRLGTNLVRTVVSSVGEVLRPIMGGHNPLQPVDTSHDDLDLPPLELLADGESIQLNYMEESISFGKWIQSFIECIREGKTDGLSVCSCSVVLKGLKRLQTYLTEHRASPDNLEGSLAADDSVMTDLALCIHKLETTYRLNPTTTSVMNALAEVRGLIAKHPVWLGSSVCIGLPEEESVEKEPIEILSRRITELNAGDSEVQKLDEEYEERAEHLVKEVAELGAFRTSYEAIVYFIGTPPPWVSDKASTPFADILTRINRTETTPEEKHDLLIAELRSMISHSTHIFFLKRWALWLFAPLLVKLSELAVTNFVEGANTQLKQFVENAHTRDTGRVDLAPIDRLTSSLEGLYQGLVHKHEHPGLYESTGEALDAYINTNEDFLKKRGPLSNVFEAVGDKAVEEYMIALKPTSLLQEWDNNLSEWIGTFPHPLVEVILTCIFAPVRAVFWIVNSVVITPIEWGINTFSFWLIKTVLRKTKGVETIVTKTKKALFSEDKGNPTSLLMNTLILNLLQQLSTQLNQPEDPNDPFYTQPISPEAKRTLGKALRSILKVVGLSAAIERSHEDAEKYLKGPSSSAISPALNNLLSTLGGKDLDGEVVESITELLARAYYLLMKPEILNQQLCIALESVKQGLEGKAAEVTEDTVIQETKLQELVTCYRKMVTRKAVHKSHTHTEHGNKDAVLHAHTEKVKTSFKDRIQKWRKLLLKS